MKRLRLRNRILSLVLFLIGMAPLTYISVKLIGAHSRSCEFLFKNVATLLIIVLLGGSLWSVCWGREAILGCGVFAFLLIYCQDVGWPFLFAFGIAGTGAFIVVCILSALNALVRSLIYVWLYESTEVRRSPRKIIRQVRSDLRGEAIIKRVRDDENGVSGGGVSDVFQRPSVDEWPNLHEVSKASPADLSAPGDDKSE